MGAIQALAPSFGAVAPYNGSSGSISGDWVALPPRNIHQFECPSFLSLITACLSIKFNTSFTSKYNYFIFGDK